MGIELHAELDLGAKIGDLQQSVDQLRKAIALPVNVRTLVQQATTPTGVSAPFLIKLGGPSVAVIWDVRSVVLVGADDHTAVANVTGAVYAGQLNAQGVVLPDLRWPGLTVPSAQTFNAQVVAQTNQQLYVALSGSGLSAGQSYLVTAVVIEVQVEDAPRYFS
ncbi:MAG TPA: hypothetical protein VJ741_09675 [Solirubrobacteraceae bacterium]|nr:hypothetical protein [Solirubrobacteraceae bacterium]